MNTSLCASTGEIVRITPEGRWLQGDKDITNDAHALRDAFLKFAYHVPVAAPGQPSAPLYLLDQHTPARASDFVARQMQPATEPQITNVGADANISYAPGWMAPKGSGRYNFFHS